MTRHILAAVGALAVAGAALTAVAEPQQQPQAGPQAMRRAGHEHWGGRPDMAAMQTELGLSAEQATQLKTMWSQGRKQAIRQRADTAIARMELEEALDAPTIDEKVVAAKQKALADLEAAALKARTDQRLAIRRILTPEQQAKMKQVMHQRFRDRGERPGQAWGRQRPGRGAGMAPPPGPGGPGLDEDGPEGPPDGSER